MLTLERAQELVNKLHGAGHASFLQIFTRRLLISEALFVDAFVMQPFKERFSAALRPGLSADQYDRP